MMTIRNLCLAICSSVILYLAVFVFLLHKPLTVGLIRDYYRHKLGYLCSIQTVKIVILAGSNGRFSHRCETIEKETGIPCSNMSITATLSLDYQLAKIKPCLGQGDIVYMPLEYGQLNRTPRQMSSMDENPYIVAYDRPYLKKLEFPRLVRTLFYFDLPYFISATGEMALEKAGIKRRFSAGNLTLQGDERSHTALEGEPYRAFLDEQEWHPPDMSVVDAGSASGQVLADFMTWASGQGILVVGGLPTTFDDEPIPEEVIGAIRQFYEERGHSFILLPAHSQYDRSCFFDTSYHLLEEWQIRHSEWLSPYLKDFFQSMNN